MDGIVEIIGDVVKRMEEGLELRYPSDSEGESFDTIVGPRIRYIFGDAQYIKDELDSYAQSDVEIKFPLVALLTPVTEQRNDSRYRSRTSLNIMIACSSNKEWSNDDRLVYSFQNILRPMYDRLLEVIRSHEDIGVSYGDIIPHEYTENYSYGRYGAYTASGEAVSEPIDAINIRSMEIILKNKTCR